MTETIKSDENSRFTDLRDEPVDHLLSPIKGYQDKPVVSLSEAIQPVSKHFNEIDDHVFVALNNCQNPKDDLTQQESASIHLYTMQFDSGLSLFRLLNRALRAENREELKPWFSYLHLFLTALNKLPSQSQTVWRGIRRIDLSSTYKPGTRFAWWGVSSCTTKLEVLESESFLGKTGERTLFSIECIQGKSVINHSYFKNTEDETILMPGSYFEVVGHLNTGNELHIIQLKEISPPVTLVKSPILKSTNTSSSAVTNKPDNLSASSLKSNAQTAESNNSSEQSSQESNSEWKQHAITVVGGNGPGDKSRQLSAPCGIYIDDDQNIYIADCGNGRIVEWNSKTNKAQIVAGGNGKGRKTNQLNSPVAVTIDKQNHSLIISDFDNKQVVQWPYQKNTNGQIIIENIDCGGLTMDQNGDYYVTDCAKNEVRRWKSEDQYGTIVAGGNGEGNELNQLYSPTYIFVDEDYSLYVSDTHNHRVMKWAKDAKEGVVVAGGNGQGENLSQLSHPRGLIVDQLGHIYIADWGNERVLRWFQGDLEGTIVVGGNGKGCESNQLDCPEGLAFDAERNLYVADFSNHRVQKFERNNK